MPINIGGSARDIGKASVTTDDSGRKIASVTADEGTLNSYITSAPDGGSVVFTVPQTSGATTNEALLTLRTVDDLAQKEMTLSVQSGGITYSMPATAVNTAHVEAALGASNPSDVTFAVTMSAASPDEAAALKSAAQSGGFELVGGAMTFAVTASYNGGSVEIDSFGAYVARAIKLDGSINPNRITTAITEDTDGTIRHIPTNVYKGSDRYYYAVINSLTNSTYTLIYNEETFNDTKGTWYDAQADEMASRKILKGISEGTFDGDKAITRAEFAAVIVRALGLPENGGSTFNDVADSSWYHGYVGAASKYGIILGRSSTAFDPNANITREEAMAMIARAAKAAGFKGVESKIGTYLDMDSVSSWAEDAVSFNLKNGLIVGSDGRIRPDDVITRAETATVVLRLLQKAGLVDIRSIA